MTSNKHHLRSVISFLHKEKQYLGASGDGGFFEVFDVTLLKEKKFLSRVNFFCLFVFFC